MIRYDPVRICAVSAERLPNMDTSNLFSDDRPDTYVRLSLVSFTGYARTISTVRQSTVVNNNNNPSWNYCATLLPSSLYANVDIRIEVKDEDTIGSDDHLGSVYASGTSSGALSLRLDSSATSLNNAAMVPSAG